MTSPRHKRRAVALEDRSSIVRTKVITSESLGSGGKLHPASFPGGSGILPEREKGRPNVSKLLEKVNDLDGYDPGKIEDDVLRDDFRIVLAWYATLKEDGEFRYDEATIHDLLKKILEEARKRGPKMIRFDPKNMKPSVKGFFLRVAREVGIPAEQFKGQVVEKQIRADERCLFFYLRLPDGVRKKLTEFSQKVAESAGSDVEEVDHITLLYIKKPKGKFSDGEAHKAVEAARESISGLGKIPVKLQGWGFFDGASRNGVNKTALVALADADGLAEVHVKIKEALSKVGIDVDQTHGFIPHATIAYLEPGTRLKELPMLGDEFQVTSAEMNHTGPRKLELREDEVEKRLNINPNTKVSELTDRQLLEAHWILHQVFRGKGPKGISEEFTTTEALSNMHAIAVDELFSRGKLHPPPPDDGLDEVSSDFEENASKQPDFWSPPSKRRIRKTEEDLAKVHSSGVKRGREISLEEVLPHFKTFKIRKPAVCLVGGLAANGKTEGDIDLLIKESEHLPTSLRHIIKFRLGRALPPELNNRVEFHFDLDKFGGPFTNFVELYDMVFERVNPENEVKQMAETIELEDRGDIYLRAAEEVEEDDVDATQGG
jgi:2'-5' RNA ligase